MDEEANKKSEETRSITNEGERDDYVSDRGWRRVQVLLGLLHFACAKLLSFCDCACKDATSLYTTNADLGILWDFCQITT